MKSGFLKNLIKSQAVLILFVLLFILFSIFIPYFFSSNNLMNILKQSSIIGIVACGLTMTVIAGNVDLSVGSVVSLCAVISLSISNRSVWLAILIPIILAIIIGMVNGLLVTKFNSNSVMITLGSMIILQGIALIYTKGGVIAGTRTSAYNLLGTASFKRFSLYILIFIVIAVILEIILNYTSLGRFIYLSGSNYQASRIAGVNIDNIKIYTFIIGSVCVALAAIILSARLSSRPFIK